MAKKKAKEPIYLTPFAEVVEIGEVKLYAFVYHFMKPRSG